MTPATPQPASQTGNLPRPTKPDYRNVFIEPVYTQNGYDELDDEAEVSVFTQIGS